MKIKETALYIKLRIWKSVAAASIIFLLIAGGHMIFHTESFTPVWVESKTSAGNITTLALSDGTIVSLNASSSISYPLYFDKKERRVKLNGEAYFEVTPDSGHPFIVETDHMKINVLGTSFNVKSYEEDEKAVMTLLEGSVSIEVNDLNPSGKKPVILTPGQQMVVDKNSREIQLLQVKPELYSSWKEGQCYFENEKFIHITKILERQFGVMIRITSPNLENQLYSGFFGKREGVLQILNSFRKYRNFDYRQDETGIEIYEK